MDIFQATLASNLCPSKTEQVNQPITKTLMVFITQTVTPGKLNKTKESQKTISTCFISLKIRGLVMNISWMLIRVQMHCHVVLKVYVLEANNLNFQTDRQTTRLRLKLKKKFLNFLIPIILGLLKIWVEIERGKKWKAIMVRWERNIVQFFP